MTRALGVPTAYLALSLLRSSRRRAGLAVVYHRIGDKPGTPERELVPALATNLFEAELRHLQAFYSVVPASELFRATTERTRWQRFPVAITFDDDLASHVRYAVPVLRRAGVPGTFFVCGASLDEPFTFWWERLQRTIDQHLPAWPTTFHPEAASALRDDPREIHAVAERIKALVPSDRDRIAAELGAALGADPPDAGLREDDLRAIAAAGFEVGFHTLRHDELPPLTDDALERALTDGRARVEAVIGRSLTLIAYPHGSADERVARAARSAGYEFGFTASPTAVLPTTDRLLIGRIEASFSSVGHLALQLVRALVLSPPR